MENSKDNMDTDLRKTLRLKVTTFSHHLKDLSANNRSPDWFYFFPSSCVQGYCYLHVGILVSTIFVLFLFNISAMRLLFFHEEEFSFYPYSSFSFSY